MKMVNFGQYRKKMTDKSEFFIYFVKFFMDKHKFTWFLYAAEMNQITFWG